MSYGTDYLDLPAKNYPIRVGRVNKMTKNSTTTTSAEASKTPRAKYAKTRGEHFKDMLIVALIVGIAAFVGGMHFSNEQHSQLNSAVKAATAPAPAVAQAPAKK